MGKPERKVQDYLAKCLKKVCTARRWQLDIEVRTAVMGVRVGKADTLVSFSDGYTFDAEVKTDTGKLSEIQAYRMDEQNKKFPLRPYIVIYGREGVDDLMVLFYDSSLKEADIIHNLHQYGVFK